jgi:IS5 family transposase
MKLSDTIHPGGPGFMLRDRYAPVDLFALAPALALEFEPVLAQLDTLLEDDALFQAVKADLARRYPHTLETGRPSTPVEVLLRMLIVRRLYAWSYAETEHFVGDSLVLRQFCRLGLARAPDDTTLLRWAGLIRPATLDELLDHVVALARQLKVTRGRKLRVDSTVVATPIRHPTDSGLLADGVRMLGRLVRRARPVVGGTLAGVRDAFRTRTRSARRQAQRIHRAARRTGAVGQAVQRDAYARLCAVTRRVVGQAERVRRALGEGGGLGAAAGRRLAAELDRLLPLVRRVLDQTERRVLRGAAVPAAEKVLSLVEPHTALITRHKPGQPVEFGRKLWLAEADGGIVTDVQVLQGAPPDAPHVAPSLERHQRQFGRPPRPLTGDRGCSTAGTRRAAAEAGVRRVALPHTGPPSAASRARERERWYRRGYRWRAGIEGRIGVLQRVYGLDRCPDHGTDGLGRWVGLGVLTANLVTIARATAAR